MSSTTTTRRLRRSPEDWEAKAHEILPELQQVGSLSRLHEQFGTHLYALQIALAKIGYDSHGHPLQLRPIVASRPKTMAKRIADRRREGEPFWQIEAESGLTYREIKALLTEHGYGEYASGRTSRTTTGSTNGSNGEAPAAPAAVDDAA